MANVCAELLSSNDFLMDDDGPSAAAHDNTTRHSESPAADALFTSTKLNEIRLAGGHNHVFRVVSTLFTHMFFAHKIMHIHMYHERSCFGCCDVLLWACMQNGPQWHSTNISFAMYKLYWCE